MSTFNVSSEGYYGEFGGTFVPEMLIPNIEELQQRYLEIINEPAFQKEWRGLLTTFVGRPSALTHAKRLSEQVGAHVYLKREDLNHTGAHKINNTVGQILLAQRLKKRRIIAETGAGQHGLATATVCARMGIECVIYMGALDIERQAPNVRKMKYLGAVVVPVTSGSQTLKDATNEAMRDWIAHPIDTHYIIGSAVGPHPFPDMVARFQSIISEELKPQLKAQCGRDYPDAILACIGGGSNAIGIFYHYLDDARVRLIGVEAAGCGLTSGKTAATITLGKSGVLHGSKTMIMQDENGQVVEAHSISAGLDYPGVGPQHAFLSTQGRVEYVSVTDKEALVAAKNVARQEGIIPALETAHAFAWLPRAVKSADDVIVVSLSGSGEKDMATFLAHEVEHSL